MGENSLNRTMSATSLAQPQERTFQLEDTLPPLPLPPLEKTLQKYLESTRPFLTDEEFENTKRIVAEFGAGVGKELHKKLQERARTHRNWVEKWWEDYAYLISRTPLTVQSNIVGLTPFHNDIWPAMEGTQCERAAIVTWYLLEYYQKLRSEVVQVDKSRGGRVFSMNQLRSLFNCARIPGETSDRIVRFFKTEREGQCPNHLIVFSNGHIFLLRPFDKEGRVMPAQEIYRQLCHIKKLSAKRGQGIGLLTADDRTSYAKAYEHLSALSPVNRRHLDAIEQSAFTIMLDDATPKTPTEAMDQSFKGDVYSRWADKSYGIVCFDTGMITCSGDHAPVDGIIIVVLFDFIHKSLLRMAGGWPTAERVGVSYEPPKELVFTIDGTILTAMEKALDTFNTNASNLQVFCSRCGVFGKRFTKSQKLHPDTVFQLALQNAYYALHRKPVATYETATTRMFYHGRTETLRSCTTESLQWCQAMADPSKSTSERHALFLEAIKKHDQNMFEAATGEGCDRHLFGLQILAMEQGMPVPALYTDPAYIKSGGGGNFNLSTSCAGYFGSVGAVAPMCPDGYAAFYAIRDDDYLPCLLTFKSSKETDVQQFFKALNASLVAIQNLFTVNNSKM